MGYLWTIIQAIMKMIAKSLKSSLPPELRETLSFWEKLKNPFNFLGNKNKKQQEESGIKGLIKKNLKKILQTFKKSLQVLGKILVSCSDVLLIILAVVLIGVMLSAILGAFGAFNGKITVDFDKFEAMNADESIYIDAQNTNELRKAYMMLVSETSYYQMFNLRDMNPDTINPFLKTMQVVVNKFTDYEIKDEDINYLNMPRTFLGWLTLDERYIYTDANKNALKHMKIPKVTSIDEDLSDLFTAMNKVNDNFRDYYNRESTFMLSETLLSEMNRILFGEFSNVESITYPEAFVKPVAFVNDYYRILDTGTSDYVGSPYVYTTQRVTKSDIENQSSIYYEKDWLEGVIKSAPSHIVYDYAVVEKNIYYWSDKTNKTDTAKLISWGNISKYAEEDVEIEFEDKSTLETKQAIKLYWVVKDSDQNRAYAFNDNGLTLNPYDEHMGANINDGSFTKYFDGPYTKLKITGHTVTVDPASKVPTTGYIYVDGEGNHTGSASTGIRIKYADNKFPYRHLQLVPVYDQYQQFQLNSRVLFNKTFVQKKSVRDSYRYYPEYFSGFQNFVEIDLERLPPAVGAEAFNTAEDSAIPGAGGGNCSAADYLADEKLPFDDRKCSIIRRYTGATGYAYVKAKLTEWGQGISNFFTGEDTEAEIGVSSQAMFYLLLAYDDYIIATGEYGVAWYYKYYTATAMDMAFQQAQYMDIFGWKEVFVDSWNDERVYKDTLDSVKKLDSKRTLSTTYVPTAIISGQSAAPKDGNVNINNSGYGWRIKTNSSGFVLANSYSSQQLERVRGEASLEYPIYNDGTIINMLKDWLTNSVTFNADNFRYQWDSTGSLVDKGTGDLDAYLNSLDAETKEAWLKNFEESDYRNKTEAWNPDADIYRPTLSYDIRGNVETGISKNINPEKGTTNKGKVTYQTNKDDYMPLEIKSVRDYGLGSVLSYVQGLRVVYQAGVYMDEAYNAKGLQAAIDSLGYSFAKDDKGYYPKELLDKHPELLQVMKTTPVPVENLGQYAANIVSLQYAATEEEKQQAMDNAGPHASEDDVQIELLKIISKRNANGLAIGDRVGNLGWNVIENSNVIGVNVCKSCAKECEGKSGSEREGCIKTCQSEGGYYNTQLDECNTRCETKKESAILDLAPTLTDEEKQEAMDTINTKETTCKKQCETDWPDRSQGVDCSGVDAGVASGAIYAYSPYMKPDWLESVADFLFGWAVKNANDYPQTQFLDPLQYYIEWFDNLATEPDEDDYLGMALDLIQDTIGGEDVLQYMIDSWQSATLRGIRSGSGTSFSSLNVSKFNTLEDTKKAGTHIVGEFKDEFFQKYSSSINEFPLISESETYRVYMIDEAVTFLGTFTYTYKDDIVNIGVASGQTQVIGMAYADRYYYVSNYIFNIPTIKYEAEIVKSYDDSSWKDNKPSCPKVLTVSQAESEVNTTTWWNPFSWFKPKAQVKDTELRCYVQEEDYDYPCTKYRYVCTPSATPGASPVCGYEPYSTTCTDTHYKLHYEQWATVGRYQEPEDGYIIDTPNEITDLINKAKELDKDSTLHDSIYINMKFYDSLSDWSWSLTQNNKTDISDNFKHDYDVEYAADTHYIGDTVDHYQHLKDVNNNINKRSGYTVKAGEETKKDVLGLPDDLHMDIDLDAGTSTPTLLTEANVKEVLSASKALFETDAHKETVTVPASGYYGAITLEGGTELTNEYDDIGVGLLMANREAYGYPIPLMRHFSGQMREILPREKGYYFNGEVFNSWNSRLILKDDTTAAQKKAIQDEKNQLQGYLYDYIMNFEAYVPYDVKSDYDLMSRGREAYRTTLAATTAHTSATTSLTGDIFNLANSEAWKETMEGYVDVANKVNSSTIAQLLSGLVEVEIKRAPQYAINILNQGITDETKQIEASQDNINTIKEAVQASVNHTGAPTPGTRTVSLKLKDGTTSLFHLPNYGPGAIFYNFQGSGAGTLSTESIAPGQVCGSGTTYDHCFPKAELTINATTDDRLNKQEALNYVSSKFGRLLRKYGSANPAIMAYFHGEQYTDALILAASDASKNWQNSDDKDLIAEALYRITGDESVRSNAEKINTFMYTSSVIKDVLAYIQDTSSKSVMNAQATLPAAASGVQIGSKKEYGQQVYDKWASIINLYADKYQVDRALISAYIMQESSNNSFAGLCGSDGISSGDNWAGRTCAKLTLNYNGGGGLGQIHEICDNGKTIGGSNELGTRETCTRTVTSKLTGDSVSVTMANPKKWGMSSGTDSSFSAYLAADERYGNVPKSLEWSIILISNNLQTYNGDVFKALVAYNAGPGAVNSLVKNHGESGWYNAYAASYKHNYVEHVMRYYNDSLATTNLKYSGTSTIAGNASMTSQFGLTTGNISFNRDQYAIQNSGVELYIPKMTTSRNDVTTMLLNVSNYGKDEYYMYANEYNLMNLFTARTAEDINGTNSWLGFNAAIIKEGEKTTRPVPSNYKFAFVTPIIPVTSPGGTEHKIKDWNVTSPFGERFSVVNGVQSTTQRSMHNGIDFGLTIGNLLYSVAPGRVVEANHGSTGYGNYITISHVIPEGTKVTGSDGKQYVVEGVYSRYAHLSQINVTVGDVISDTCGSEGGTCRALTYSIGKTGNTGNSTGPHLHFEIFIKVYDPDNPGVILNGNENQKCDPYYWLTTEWAQGAGALSEAMNSAEVNRTIATIRAQYPNLSMEREYFIRNALSLVGKVKYFWGGGHTHPPYKGIKPSWLDGTKRAITINSPGGTWKVGNMHYDGLDCSGFASWVSYNTFNVHYYSSGDTVSGIVANEHTKTIPSSQKLPGDYAYKADQGHIGIYLYTDENGKDWFVHSADDGKYTGGVVVNTYSKFVNFLRVDYMPDY